MTRKNGNDDKVPDPMCKSNRLQSSKSVWSLRAEDYCENSYSIVFLDFWDDTHL